jgi:hypothetical protein
MMNKNTIWFIVGSLLVLIVGAGIGFGLGMRFGVAQAAGINFSDPSTWPDANKDGTPDVAPGAMYAHMAQVHGRGGWGGHMGGFGWFSPFGMMGGGMMGGGLSGLLTLILLGVIIYLLARRNTAPAVTAPLVAPVETKKK